MRLARLAAPATLALALLAAPLAAEAQSAGRVFRIAWLTSTTAEFAPETDRSHRAFAEGLQALGDVIGQNVALKLWPTEGHPERLTKVATDVARSNPDVIFAPGTPIAQAVSAATASIPIVFCFAADPVRDGLIESFARPGRNLTGLSTVASDLSAKRLELLRSLVPANTRIGAVVYPSYEQGDPCAP